MTLDERMERSAETVRQIRAELEVKAAAGDMKARRLLRELWPESAQVQAEDAAVVLTHLQRTAPRDPGEEG